MINADSQQKFIESSMKSEARGGVGNKETEENERDTRKLSQRNDKVRGNARGEPVSFSPSCSTSTNIVPFFVFRHFQMDRAEAARIAARPKCFMH